MSGALSIRERERILDEAVRRAGYSRPLVGFTVLPGGIPKVKVKRVYSEAAICAEFQRLWKARHEVMDKAVKAAARDFWVLD